MCINAKFRNFSLRINKALGIFRKRITTSPVTTRKTVVALRDPSGSKNVGNENGNDGVGMGGIRNTENHSRTAHISSPDVRPDDYGWMQQQVYRATNDNCDEMKQRFIETRTNIPQAVDQWRTRLRACMCKDHHLNTN